jgi:hypothetical protein
MPAEENDRFSSSGQNPNSNSQGINHNDLSNYEFKNGANWNPENVQTLMQWVHVGAIYLEIMTEATSYYKSMLRKHSVLNLIMSTLSGTASLSQFSINENNNPMLNMLLKIFFTIMTFTISISVGYLKIYQIQEKMEQTIRLQQEWAVFGSKITSEIQLPESLRKDALFLIIRLKETYLELIKSQVEVSKKITYRVARRNGLDIGDLTLSEMFERAIKGEALRLKAENKALRDSESNVEDTNIVFYETDNESPYVEKSKYKHPSLNREDSQKPSKINNEFKEKLSNVVRNTKNMMAIMSPDSPSKVSQTITNRKKLSDYIMRPIAPALSAVREITPDTSNMIIQVGGITSPKDSKLNRKASTEALPMPLVPIPKKEKKIPTLQEISSEENFNDISPTESEEVD